MDNQSIKDLIELRKKLHKNAELSGFESKTAEIIDDYFQQLNTDGTITDLGGHGLAFIFNGKNAGPDLLLRCDMDALPIQEKTAIPYKSINQEASHKCGHDGHMTVMVGIGRYLSENKPQSGRVILLFQPAEETGEGAQRVIEDKKFLAIKPEYSFAFHNLPGFEENEIILRKQVFASASKGMIIKLKGRTSHAGQPEKGISPSVAISKLINFFENIKTETQLFSDYILTTIIHINVGEIAFGTSPGEGTIMITLRANRNEDMNLLTQKSEGFVQKIAKEEKLEIEISYTEVFPATINNDECVDILEESANEMQLNIVKPEQNFRWSEDFGHFTKISKGALFGIGAGINHPPLHHPHYDYPDNTLKNTIGIFVKIIEKTLNK